MNKIFKKIWNKRRGCFVAVSEVVRSASQRSSKATQVCIAVAVGAAQSVSAADIQEGYLTYDIWNNQVINEVLDLRDRKVTLNGRAIVNGTLNAAIIGLATEGNKDNHSEDYLIINSGASVNVLDHIQTVARSGGYARITNDGTLNFQYGAYINFDGLNDDNNFLRGSGIINGGLLTFSNLPNIRQNAIQNFSALTLSNSNLTVTNLSGTNFTFGAGSSVSASHATLGNGTNAGNSSITDMVINNKIQNTGYLNVANLSFGQNGRLISSGTIQTSNASNIFDSLGSQRETALTSVSLDAQFPEETKTALTDLFRHYVPGSVAQNLIDHATFTGGKVIVTGVNLTQTQAADLTKAFKSKFVVFEFYRLSSFSSSWRTK